MRERESLNKFGREWIMGASNKGPRQQQSYLPFQEGVPQQPNRLHTSIKPPLVGTTASGYSDPYTGLGITQYATSALSNARHTPNIAYRPIRPSDYEDLREMHESLFPIRYEPEFYHNVVMGQGIISWAAVDTSRDGLQADEIIGFVTARTVGTNEIDATEMLGYETEKMDRTLLYILTLGVIQPYRNMGIASSLIWEVIEHALTIPSCRAVYLHVISYNQTAIHFYQKNSFQCLRKLDNFYYFNGRHYDAFLYIYYVNGGRSPCSAIDFFMKITGYVRRIFSSVVGRLFWTRAAKKAKSPKSKPLAGLLNSGRGGHMPAAGGVCLYV